MKNKEKFMLVIAFLTAVFGQLSANTKDYFTNSKIQPRDGTLVVRNTAVAGGIVNLLEGYNSQQTGINDFNGQQLTSGRNFVVDALTINYGVAATGTAVHAAAYTTALPAALLAGNLVIKQKDEVVRRISIAAINQAKSADTRFYELDSFALLRDEHPTRIEIEFPAGSDLAAGGGNSGYVEVIFKGFETNIK